MPPEAGTASGWSIRALERLDAVDVRQLSDLLIDCVEGGASVGFMWPMTRIKAAALWRSCAPAVAERQRLVLVAQDTQGRVHGSVSVILRLPENQPHRGELAKLLVHRQARRRGLGAALLDAAERAARDAGKSLLVLDTETGGAAERLYARHGWQRCGAIPGYALMPDGRPCSTTVFYKALDAAPTGSADASAVASCC